MAGFSFLVTTLGIMIALFGAFLMIWLKQGYGFGLFLIGLVLTLFGFAFEIGFSNIWYSAAFLFVGYVVFRYLIAKATRL